MAASEELVGFDGPQATPYTYQLPPRQAFTPSVVNATFDGTGAAGSFLPCVSIYSQDGRLLSRTFPGTVAAGDVAEVTYGPFLKAPSSLAAVTPRSSGGAVWVTGGYQGTILAETSLVGYWRMDNDPGKVPPDSGSDFPDISLHLPVTDAIMTQGAQHNLSQYAVAGAPGDPTDGAYKIGALNPTTDNADSLGDFFTVANVAKFRTASYSWEAWVFFNANQGPPSGGQADNLAFYPIFDNRAWQAPLSGVSLAVRFQSTDAAPHAVVIGSPNSGPITLIDAGQFPLIGYHHVVLTVDGPSGTVRLYVDGVDAGHYYDVGQGGYAFSAANTFRLGGGFPAGANFGTKLRTFPGQLDEMAVYNVALSPAEVLLHFNAYGPKTDTGHWMPIPLYSSALVGSGSIGTAQIADNAITTAKLASKAVTAAKIADVTITDAQVAAANKDGAAATPSLRTIGTGALQAMGGNDARLLVKASPVYGVAVTPNAAAGVWQTITANNAVAFTVNAPANAPGATGSQELTIEIKNSSGGALGAVTWNAAYVFTNGAFVAPANGKSRHVVFRWNGTAWIEIARALADY